MMHQSCGLIVTRVALASKRLLSNVPTATATQTYFPVDFTTNAKIEGEESQIATIRLSPGERIRAESGSMLFMTQGVEMETSSSARDGMKRFLTGQNIFVTDFYYEGTKSGIVALGTRFPSKILKLTLQDYPDEKLICQKGAYLASNLDVNIEMEFTKNFQAGFFGGQGFVLQKLEGKGDVLLQAGGTLVRKDLDEGATLRISSGCLVAFTSTIDYDVSMMPGFNNVVFGGEGLFVTTLKGPGTVWLQGMPPDRLISEIARRVPPGMGLGIPIPMGVGGGGGDASIAGEASPNDGSIPTTDAFFEADRQASVATSGLDSVDSESPNALFGDAAPSVGTTSPTFQDDTFVSSSTDSSTFEKSNNIEDIVGNDFADDTSFAGDDDFSADFKDDETSFSTFEGSGAGEAFSDGDAEELQSTANRILNALWDMFKGDD